MFDFVPRIIGNIGLTFMTKLATGYWHVFNPQNVSTAVKSAALTKLDLAQIHNRFFFENDMLIQLNYQRPRVTDVAIPARYGSEVSDLNPFKIGVTFPLLPLRLFFRRVYQKYILHDFTPIALFLLLGFALFFWGFAFGIYLWIRTAITGNPTPTGTIMLALLPLLLGFQLLLQRVVLDMQETPK